MNLRPLYYLTTLLFLLGGCRDENGAEPGDTGIFMRYFGSEYSHLPKQVIETDDGYLILANIELPTGTFGVSQYKVKLIKTDFSGILQWQRVYPAFDDTDRDQISIAAASLMATDDGYVIVGSEINMAVPTSPVNLAMLHLNKSGDTLHIQSIDGTVQTPALSSTSDIEGYGVVAGSTAGRYVVLGSVSNNGAENVILTEVEFGPGTRPIQHWTKFHANGSTNADGSANISDRLFFSSPQFVWAGATSNQITLRGVKAEEETLVLSRTDEANGTQKTITSACRTRGGLADYAVVGTTNEAGTDDIYFLKFNSVTETEPEVRHSSIIDFGGQNDAGVGITPTFDGGLLVVGNAGSAGDAGYGLNDILAVRLDDDGVELWRKNYGSSAQDYAASVIQTDDGGFLILGSSEFGDRFRKISLTKVNRDGEFK